MEQVNGSHIMTVSAGGGATRAALAESRAAKESVSLDVKRAFPYGIYGRG